MSLIIQNTLSQVRSEIAFGLELQQVISRWLKYIPRVLTVDVLPLLACSANGGSLGAAVPVTAAWQLVRFSAKLLDDVEDGALGDDFPVNINIATGLLICAHLALANLSSQVSMHCAWHISQALDHAVLKASAGQHADLMASRKRETPSPEGWLEIARAKSGALFGWAAWAGAVAGGAEEVGASR